MNTNIRKATPEELEKAQNGPAPHTPDHDRLDRVWTKCSEKISTEFHRLFEITKEEFRDQPELRETAINELRNKLADHHNESVGKLLQDPEV